MFTVTVDDKEYKINFYHVRPGEKAAQGFKVKQLKNGITYAIIKCTNEGSHEIYYGMSPVCSFDDQFDKNQGRKRALADTLKSFNSRRELDKGVNKLFWLAYFEAMGRIK